MISVNKIAALTGMKRNALACLCGLCATLALPPFFLFPLIIPAYAGLYSLATQASTKKRAFWDGWWWGWGFYISGLYWFTIALLTDPEKFAWLIPFALFALTAVIAVYQGIACWIYAHACAYGIKGVMLFSSIWVGVEYARGHLFTGFPWNLAGYSLSFSDRLLQLAALVGIYGLTFYVVLLGSAAALIRHTRMGCVVLWSTLILAWCWGGWRLPATHDTVPGITLRLVQANIAQHHKWDPQLQFEGLRKHVELTQSPGLDKVTHVIWPETATPYVVRSDSTLTQRLGDMLLPGQLLITGALHAENAHMWNSVMAINPQGEIVGSYDKYRLVPFGEFLPFRAFIPAAWLTPVGSKDFDRGDGAKTLSWPGLPDLSALICYESIFPESVIGASRPQFFLNLTNDAWFGMSSGPYQHFEMARMRAVEQGIPLVRLANTGITAVIDSYGRIQHKLELGTQGVLDAALPLPQVDTTPYGRYGDKVLIVLIISSAILTMWKRRES